MAKQLKKKINDVLYLLNSFKKSKIGRKHFFNSILMSILDTISPVVNTIIPGLIINELVEKRRFENIILLVSILILVILLRFIKERTLRISINKSSRELKRIFQAELQQYISQIEYSYLETPEVSVQLNRISMHAPVAPLEMLNYICSLISAVLNIVLITAVMTYLSPFVIIVLLSIVVINAYATKRINLANYSYGKQISEKENIYWTEFYNLTNHSNGKEMRLFKTKDFFIERYTTIGREIDNIYFSQDITQKKWMIIHTITSIVQLIILYVIGIYNVICRGTSIGTMTIFLSAAGQFSGVFEKITNIFLKISSYCLNVDEIRKFFEYPITISAKESNLHISPDSTIEFRNVSFKYPGSERFSLSHINFLIKMNDIICFVGENGSGKTTFVKLLTRLYKPTEGVILLDGKDINELNIYSYQKIFSPVFQDFSKYSLPIKYSVALEKEFSEEKIYNSLKKVGLITLIQNLPKGIDTYIGKNIEKDGFEPSGGEAQKIAIARALYHSGEIYILDEPTASLDPNAENEIYTDFKNMINGKAAIMITHRLSAVHLSKKIVVFDKGEIIESGTHDELYSKGGQYKKMYDKQAQFYRNDSDNIAKSHDF